MIISFKQFLNEFEIEGEVQNTDTLGWLSRNIQKEMKLTNTSYDSIRNDNPFIVIGNKDEGVMIDFDSILRENTNELYISKYPGNERLKISFNNLEDWLIFIKSLFELLNIKKVGSKSDLNKLEAIFVDWAIKIYRK